jgi:hypothetical protein
MNSFHIALRHRALRIDWWGGMISLRINARREMGDVR